MGVQFFPTDTTGRPLLRCSCEDFTCEACSTQLALSLCNAGDLLEHLGLPRQLWGSLPAAELADRCERRLTRLTVEAEIPTRVEGRVVWCSRSAGYLRDRTAALLAIAITAGDGLVVWS